MASAKYQLGSGMAGLLKDGYSSMSGLEMAILKNIEACMQLGKVTRTSLGPNGMNKMVINHLEKLFVTSDAATITTELEVVHPAAKMLVMAAKMQEHEHGDCTNFAITFASELLKNAEGLLRMGVHASDVISGYKKASVAALEMLSEIVCHTVTNVREKDALEEALRAVVASKQYGYEDILADCIAQACTNVIPPAPHKLAINTDNVRIAKLMGGNIHQTEVIKGMVVQRHPAGVVQRVENAKVAVFGTSVEASQTETKGTVMLSSADELLNYNKSEENLLDEQIRGIKESGVDVIIAGGAISQMALHFIDRYELLVVKVTSKWELRRLCRAMGATAVVRLGPVSADEMGHCDLVESRMIGGNKCTIFSNDKEGSRVSTVVLRSSTTNQIDDLARAVDDGIATTKTLCKDARLLPGAGATEIELALRIAKLGESTPGLEQYAINKYAEAFEVIPRTLAENAGKDATSLVSSLYAAHKKGQVNAGVDIDEGSHVLDAHESKIYDTFASKLHALRLASDAAITVLRVDQIIMSKQAGGPKKK